MQAGHTVYFNYIAGWFHNAYQLAKDALANIAGVAFLPLEPDAVPGDGVDMSTMEVYQRLVTRAVQRLGKEPRAIKTIGSESTYGVVFAVDTVTNERLAIKLFKPAAGMEMIVSSANLYQLASQISVGPRFNGAFTDGQLYALVMERFEMDVEQAYMRGVTAAQHAEIGRQIDDILRRLAAVGWACKDLKPRNFVINFTPAVTVRIIDVDREFCAPIQDLTIPEITTYYIAMKAAMELISRAHLHGAAHLPDGTMFGPDFETSGELAFGVHLLRRDADFEHVVRSYHALGPQWNGRVSTPDVAKHMDGVGRKLANTLQPHAGRSAVPARNKAPLAAKAQGKGRHAPGRVPGPSATPPLVPMAEPIVTWRRLNSSA